MELEIAKKFLHVDYDDDDEIIKLQILASKEYIKNAIGIYDDENPLMKLLLLNIITDLYDSRSYTITNTAKNSYTTRSIVMQLQLQYSGDKYEN